MSLRSSFTVAVGGFGGIHPRQPRSFVEQVRLGKRLRRLWVWIFGHLTDNVGRPALTFSARLGPSETP